MARVDPVTLELVRNRLVAGAQQMAVTIWKSAYSTVVREVLDYSTALFDERGQMVAQSAQIPFQMMTMSAPMRYLVDRGFDWDEDDVVLLNDPYACDGQHLPDVMTFRPIFAAGELVAFAGAVAHMIDVGGGAAGSYFASATEIIQEGIRIPPVKIYRGGQRNQELFDVIALNVREPGKVVGDINAMCAATTRGEAVVRELLERHGAAGLRAAMREILDGTERQVRRRLSAIPEGTYHGLDYLDDDGIGDQPVRIELNLTRRGETVSVDFTGTSPQGGPINATLSMTRATVVYVLMAAIGEGIPKTDGWGRVIEVIAPPGTVVNARDPAPVASRVTTCHRLVDVMLQALSKAIPERVMAGYYGASNICNIGGRDAETGAPWVNFEIEVGGWGARPTSDGLDGYSAHIHNLANTPIEVVESTHPIRVERYEFIPGSGGIGQFRGGLGLRRDLRTLSDGTQLNLLGDHCRFPAAGMFGGGNSVPGRYVLNPDSDREQILPNKLSNYPMARGDVISMQTSGGGGYGDPALRDAALAERDRREGKVTR